MLGEENSTIIRFRPFDGSEVSLSPILGLKPYDPAFLMIEGITILASGSGLKKNLRNVLSAIGLLIRGDSGNCKFALALLVQLRDTSAY